MANKRMFSKEIVNSDAFLDMPMTTQCLYFHLNMVADDDGFVSSPKRIMKMIGASDDDMKLLIMKSFILSSELWNGVVVVKHWRINNFMQKDRYKPTLYQEEKSMVELKNNGAYTWKKAQKSLCDCSVNKMLTQNSIDKNSIDKNSIEEPTPSINFIGNRPTKEEVELYCRERNFTFNVDDFYEYYDEVNWTAKDSRHSFNWKKKCELWESNQRQKNDNSKKVSVPDFMRDQADGKIKEEKKASQKLIAQVKAMQKEMEGDT